MGSQTRSARGQALIETTFAVPMILLLLSAGTAAVMAIKRNFKHDFTAASDGPAQIRDLPRPLQDLIRKNFVTMPKGSVLKNLAKLKDDGWQIQTQMKSAKTMLYLLRRNNETMVFDGHFGEKTCSKKGLKTSN